MRVPNKNSAHANQLFFHPWLQLSDQMQDAKIQMLMLGQTEMTRENQELWQSKNGNIFIATY